MLLAIRSMGILIPRSRTSQAFDSGYEERFSSMPTAISIYSSIYIREEMRRRGCKHSIYIECSKAARLPLRNILSLYMRHRQAAPSSRAATGKLAGQAYTAISVVSLMCCSAKLERISTTAGCCISLSIAKRENWLRSSTCTRNR